MDNPQAKSLNSIDLKVPLTGTSLTLNPNLYKDNALTIKWTSADFGYSASVKYVLQIVKTGDAFEGKDIPMQVIPIGTFNENTNSIHEYSITTTTLNSKLKATGVDISLSSDVKSSFLMRVYAQPSGQLTTSTNAVKIYSQSISLSSNVYDPIDETPKIYVMGSFGAASTFADWNINQNGFKFSAYLFSSKRWKIQWLCFYECSISTI
jgi:hypothetical protein